MVRPSVHPIEAPPSLNDNDPNHPHHHALPRQSLKDIQGMPATLGGFLLRFFQFAFALASLSVMASTSDFPSVSAFRYLVASVGLQSLWSLSWAIADIYAILIRRSFRNSRIVSLLSIGDGITSTMTFSAACASAGITVLIGNDLNDCAQNHCSRFETATAMAFMSWFAALPSFILNFWTLASK